MVLMGKVLWTVFGVHILYDVVPLQVLLLLLGHIGINQHNSLGMSVSLTVLLGSDFSKLLAFT